MGDMHVPGLGNVKKGYVYAGVGGIAVIGGIAYWRHQANATANTATPADATASDPIDPTTGIPYSQENGGSYPSYPYGTSDYGGGTGYPYSPPSSSVTTGITTNTDWATEAENALLAEGITIEASSQAINKVLAGLPVTVDQQSIFMQAVGLLQDPPNGYPRPIKLLDTPGHPKPPSMVTVPNVVGMNFGKAFNTLTVANLTSDPGHGGRNATWIVTAQSVKAGSSVKPHTVVKLTVPEPKVVKK